MSVMGIIAKWDDDKGFGFIEPSSGGSQIFFHIKALPSNRKRPRLGAKVSFDVLIDGDGRRRAENVMLVGGHLAFGSAMKSFIFAGAFIVLIAAAVVYGYLPVAVFYLYSGMSILSFIMYFRDKSAAEKGRQRTPENTLHLISLGCGWPGALFAQQFLRHKTIKKPFRVIFWVTVVVNISTLLFLLSPHGSLYLAKLQGELNIAPSFLQKGGFF